MTFNIYNPHSGRKVNIGGSLGNIAIRNWFLMAMLPILKIQ